VPPSPSCLLLLLLLGYFHLNFTVTVCQVILKFTVTVFQL
jgi:hypothetical protein